MKGVLEQLRALVTSGTRVAGLLQTPSQLVCGAMIDGTTFDVGTSRRTGVFDIELDNLLLCVEGRATMGLVGLRGPHAFMTLGLHG
jgi:hypothetical protein